MLFSVLITNRLEHRLRLVFLGLGKISVGCQGHCQRYRHIRTGQLLVKIARIAQALLPLADRSGWTGGKKPGSYNPGPHIGKTQGQRIPNGSNRGGAIFLYQVGHAKQIFRDHILLIFRDYALILHGCLGKASQSH